MSSATTNLQPFTFGKQERIVSQKLIDELFTSRQSHALTAFPLRAVYIIKERAREDVPAVQLLISVPKRHFKHAVDRNRVKRQLREAYRHHKEILSSVLGEDETVALAFIWLSDQHVPSATVDRRVVALLERIAKAPQKPTEAPKAPKAPLSSPEGDTIDTSAKTIEAPSGAVGGASLSSQQL
mgnify:CR=1 FL=1